MKVGGTVVCLAGGRHVWQQNGSDISSHLRISFPGWLSIALVAWLLVKLIPCLKGFTSQMRVTTEVQKKQRIGMKEGGIA